ncbi:MAG: hypothetical protein ACXW1U_20140 [Methylobacter sp.]
MTTFTTPTPDADTQAMLDSLRQTVAKTLECKRQLGHYIVLWDGNKPVLVGKDAPTEQKQQSDR